ncbi:MAG: hypothetical protein HYX28_03530 [Candidatus Koribacter versatilis]|uniref:Uncharacterized protein n=1 Tax=Candidatus Korobacter versatilis TaxID=658062 RepID=A0A932ENY3_9BACT|nr:hypothetical protein [Candidatus Koribacter versatilis]
MAGEDNQRKAFDFLLDHLDSQEPFSKEEFERSTSWEHKSFQTYWSKQFKPFVAERPDGKFRVTEAFRPYSFWNRFRQHVSQVRKGAPTYERNPVENVIIFEFFLPLTNEEHLRTTLDALFIRNTVLARLRGASAEALEQHFPREGREDIKYTEAICEWLAERFLGYSINHVSGRFRAGPLRTREEIAALQPGQRYFIDETTAVVRFIFPCADEIEGDRVRWFFNQLFTQSILELVGEDEVWVVESGMQSRMDRWKSKDVDEEPND